MPKLTINGQTITTKAVYDPAGRAKEYARDEFALNLRVGCSHGCTYCYGSKALFMTKEEFQQPRDRNGIIISLVFDCAKLKAAGYTGNIFLCFACDPYDPVDSTERLTRQAIKIIHAAGMHVTILTKGGARSEADFDLLGPGDKYGATLTFTNEADREIWEPNAAHIVERMEALRTAHSAGIETFASLEPVIYPEQSKQIVRLTYGIVDEFRVGKLNYNSAAKETDWVKFRDEITEILDSLGCRYYIKKDLQEAV